MNCGGAPWHEERSRPSWLGRAKRLNTCALKALEWRRRWRLPEYFLGQPVDDANVKRLLGIVNGGCGVVNSLIEEALRVYVTGDVNRGLQTLAPKWKQNKTQGKRERDRGCENQHPCEANITQSGHPHSNEFVKFHVREPLSVQMASWIQVSLA